MSEQFIRGESFSAFESTNVGQVGDGVLIERRRNTDGTYYFRASTNITHIFGSELAGDGALLEGFGTT